MASTPNRARRLVFHFVSVLVTLSLLSNSAPAAPQAIFSFAKEETTALTFWYYANGLNKLLQGRGTPVPPRPERQVDRDAKITRLEISPDNVTIDLAERIRFVAVAYDREGNAVGGARIRWQAQAATGKRGRISPLGEFQPTVPGVFTIMAQAAGRSAQTIVTVREGAKPNLDLAPTGSREVSTRDLPTTTVGSIRPANNAEKRSGKSNEGRARGDLAKQAHAAKAARAVSPRPMTQSGGWDSTNYWSADDPGNRVGDPPGATLDGGAGSGNFQFAAPIYSAPGRGINISLGLAYNSRVWNKANTQISYDNDRGWPSPGFNLGFGKLLGMTIPTGCMLVDADGTRHGYSGNITFYSWGTYGVMHTTDGSFIDYTYTTGTNGVITGAQAKLPNGTNITYGAYSQAGGGVFPTFIEDANGNFITITYVNNAGPRIQTVTDTLGRVINFHYDYNNLLTAVTAPGLNSGTRTLVRLHYRQLSLNYGFSYPQIQTIVVPNSVPWVLDAIYYPNTGTGYWLYDSYSSYGMLMSVIEQRGMSSSNPALTDMGTIYQGTLTRKEEYNYPAGPDYSLADAPTYTSMTETWTRDGTTLDSATTGFQVFENSTPRTTTVTLPNGRKNKQYSFNAPGQWNDGLVYEDRTFTTDENSPLQKSTSSWEQGAYNSARPTRVQKFDERGNMTAAEFSYGPVYNQVTEVRDYDYGGTALLRSTRTTYQNSAVYTGSCYSYGCYGRHIFNLPLTVEIYASDNVTRVSRTEYQYDGQPLTAAPGVVMHDQAANPWAENEGYCYWDNDWNDPDCTGSCWDYNCDGYCNQIWVCPYDYSTEFRGNLTQATTYADAINLTSPVTETRRYDVTGNLVTLSSSCCEQTSFNYTINTQFGYPESKTRGSTSDWHSQITNSALYDFNTGLLTYSTDTNGRPSQTVYDPNTLRTIRSVLPTGAHTDYLYDDGQMTVTSTTYLEAHPTDATIANKTMKLLNGRGQVRQEKALGANSVWDLVDTSYDQMGQVSQQTRPYRTGDTPQWTSMTYDVLGRTTAITGADSSVTQTFYNEPSRPDVASNLPGETTRVQDAWGRERWGRTDANGRLVEVVEPVFWGNGSVSSGMQTTYTYNTLGNLITINSMSGTQVQQTRSFRYDSLGRLTAQKLAEMNATLNDAGTYVGSGTWSEVFTYDDRSNLTSRTDARGVKTVYNYGGDPLNRLQSVSWDTSGFGDTTNPILGAATVSYSYRTKSSSTDTIDVTQPASISTAGIATETYAYTDGEGRVNSKTVSLPNRPGVDFATDYTYDSLDRVFRVLYPREYGNGAGPRKLVENTYDIASRLSGLTFDGQTQAANISYNAASQTTQLKVGTGTNEITENYSYNAQTGSLESQTVAKTATPTNYLLNLTYDYTNANNKRTGQLTKIYNNVDHAKDRGFEYDALGRLSRATGGQGTNVTWAQRYEYDRYGNRSNVYSFILEDYVKNFYQGALNRQPTTTELNTRLSTLRSAYAQGQSQFLSAMQTLGRDLFTSSEYIARGRLDTEFVTDLYHAFLYREPDSEGLAYWVSVTPTNGRDNIRLAFEVCPEFYTKVAGTSPYAPSPGVTVPRDGLQNLAYNQATNRIAITGWNYDAAGNQTRALAPDSTTVFRRYQYDAANRLVKVKNDSGTTIASYTYTDSNERLIAQDGDENSNYRTYYVGEGGATIAEFNETPSSPTTPVWSKSYVYLGSRLLSTLTPNGGGTDSVQYHHPDRLGTRIITNPSTGGASEQVTLPFGTALDAESYGTPSKRRFTTYDRSDTTKLDYAVNRHYDSQQGRFTQPDRIGMSDSDLSSPQSFNLYAYCMNDPVNHTDPSGLGFFSFLKKIGKALLKVLKSKWFQIALAVAIIVIAHFYPQSIFGALGGGSSAGGTAPILHGAGASAGFAGAAGAASAAGYWSTFTVAALEGMGAVSTGIATAVSLGLAGALAAGVVSGLDQADQHSSKSRNSQGKMRCPPTADELAKNPKVISALKEALKRGLERKLEHGGWVYWNSIKNRLFTIIKEPTVDPLHPALSDRWDRVFLNNPPSPPNGTIIVGSFHVHLEAVGPSGDFENAGADQFKAPGIHMDSEGKISTYGNYKRALFKNCK